MNTPWKACFSLVKKSRFQDSCMADHDNS